jgi:hypothetical protein
MFNLFKRLQKTPTDRGMYAFTKHRKGDFLLYIKEEGDVYKFMQLPDRYEFNLTKEEYTTAITTKVLDFVEQVPENVFEVAAANIEKLEKL